MTAIKRYIGELKIWLICLFTVAVMAMIRPAFISQNNIEGILSSMMAYGVAALGLTVSLIAGEINIAIGSIVAFSGVVFARLVPSTGIFVALILALLLCLALGVLDGFFVAYKKLPAFLVAVVFLISVRGLALWVSDSRPILITDPTFESISAARVGPIPACFFLFILFVIAVEIFLKYTQMGRNMYATGGNAEAADAAGLNVRFYKFSGLTFSALMAGMGGILLTTRLSSAVPSVGEDAVMTVMPIIVIGGTSLNGGKGSAVWTLSGAFLMYLIFNVMSMFNIYVNVQSIIKGVIVLGIVVVDKYFANKNKKV